MTSARDVRVALAFDFGLRRIGLAAGDTLTRTAAPRGALRTPGSGIDWPALDRVVREIAPHVLVVGKPYNPAGEETPMTQQASEFAALLASRYGLPVEMTDERYSSLEATARLQADRASGARRRRLSKEDIDSAAAAVILERWFERWT